MLKSLITQRSPHPDIGSGHQGQNSPLAGNEETRALAVVQNPLPAVAFPDELGPQEFKRCRLVDENRSREQIREHYEIEVALADRLRRAGPTERPALYQKLYDELFRRVPHHPQVTRKCSADDEERLDVDRQLSFLRPHLESTDVLLEMGAGDCAVSRKVAAICSQVYALDVSPEIAVGQPLPTNCKFVLSSGCDIPLAPLSVDVVYSNQLMEHLHPDDAHVQLNNIQRVIRPGGKYVCVTPNRVCGPWDVSMYFDEVARGFHLREYSLEELTDLLHDAGFSRVDVYAGGRGYFMRAPQLLVRLAESVLKRLPYGMRSRLGRWMPVRGLLGLRVVAWKP